MKRIIVSLCLALSIFLTGTMYSATTSDLIPANSKVVIMARNLDLIENVISAAGDDEKDIQDAKKLLAVFDTSTPAYVSVFGDIPSLKDMDDAMESNLVIIINTKSGTKDLYSQLEEMSESKSQKMKNGVVGIDDVFILPLSGKMVAISPMADTLYRYKQATMLNKGSGEDVNTIKAFINTYSSKDFSALVVPSVFTKLLEENPMPFPPALAKYNFIENLKDMVIYTEDKSFVLSLRMKESSSALKNIFAAKLKGITVKQHSPKDPLAYVELAFSPDFLKDILTMISEQKGSSMPPEMLDSVFSALTGNFGVSIWPEEGKDIKDITKGMPGLLAFVGTSSDSAAQQLLGMIGAMSPFTTITVAGREVYEMTIKEDNTAYIVVDKSNLVVSLDKKTLEKYISSSKSSKNTFNSALIDNITKNEIQGISIYFKAKELLESFASELKMDEISKNINFEKMLLYIGPSAEYDAFNIKILYK